jgi:hypothetical protein
MGRYLAIAIALFACSKKPKDEGLAPAQNWGQDPGALAPAGSGAAATNPHAANPHGGGANPHAGLDIPAPEDMPPGTDPSNPHAGMDMNNPHGGGTDVSQLGLPAPDPSRPIDPTHHVTGVLKIHPKAKDKVKPGTAVFLVVKRADASGQPTGTPLAVEKVTWDKDGQAFELTEQQAMIAGTQLTGDVVVMAHYDQDGDAISKQPGDVMGQIKVKIPADNVSLFLDDVLQ